MKKIEKFFLLFSLIVFFEPQLFKEESVFFAAQVDMIYKILKLICAFFICIEYIKCKNFKVSKLVLLTCTIQLVTGVSTIINHGSITRLIGPAITTITMAMICEILIQKEQLIYIFKKINIYFRICFVINVFSIILIDFTSFRQICSVYFLGIDNRFIFTLLPWILFEGLVSINEENKLNMRWKIVVILSESLLLYKFSVSAMICIGLYLILFLNIFSNRKMAKHNVLYFTTYIITNILIVFKKSQNIISAIVEFLGKDITFSGRTYLWDGIIQQFYNYPLIGHGMQSINYDKNFFYISTAPYYLEFCKVSHAHNSLMTLLYRGGIISVTFYLIIVFEAFKQLKNNVENKYTNILLITLGIILIASIFDTMDFAGLYFILAIIINIKKLNEKKEN